jgi:hypothetical protein
VAGRLLMLHAPSSPAEAEGEARLTEAGVSVPIDNRSDWVWARGSKFRVVEIWSAEERECRVTLPIEIDESRALPGFQIWRVERLAGGGDLGAVEASIPALADLARSERRVVRLTIRLATLDNEVRARWAEAARRAGYVRVLRSRGYERTIWIDLTRPEEAILADMHASCRRAIRAVGKNPIKVALVEEASSAGRVTELVEETKARTAGCWSSPSWEGVIEYARAHPSLARLVGMFSTDDDRLLAFALGLRQGDSVEYRAAASTRDGVSAPLGYALAWDLIRWAKDEGAEWFDFGGIPTRTAGELEGIMRFKHAFGGEPVDYREEWELRSRRILSGAQHLIATGARAVGGGRA